MWYVRLTTDTKLVPMFSPTYIDHVQCTGVDKLEDHHHW